MRVKNTSNLKKRHAKNFRLKAYGIISISFSLLFLIFLLSNIAIKSFPAFFSYKILLSVNFSKELVEKKSYKKILLKALAKEFKITKMNRNHYKNLTALISKNFYNSMDNFITKNPNYINKDTKIWLLASSPAEMFFKKKVSINDDYLLNKTQFKYLQYLQDKKYVKKIFNIFLFSKGDSRYAEMAGILSSLFGSIFMMFICILTAFPIGICTAIYLEEFSPKNKLTDFIELNINNLAAVPSIVFGLLGLSLYIHFLDLPRASSLVGGLTLSMLALPIIIISTRVAIRSIPQYIRDAAIGLGATKLQTTFHHVLPLSIPGIMSGAILSISRILGETAPLLMVGMVAFIMNHPTNLVDPSTALPVQVYLWADSPELGFAEKTSAAIAILLVILLCFNSIAIYMRNKFETKW